MEEGGGVLILKMRGGGGGTLFFSLEGGLLREVVLGSELLGCMVW